MYSITVGWIWNFLVKVTSVEYNTNWPSWFSLFCVFLEYSTVYINVPYESKKINKSQTHYIWCCHSYMIKKGKWYCTTSTFNTFIPGPRSQVISMKCNTQNSGSVPIKMINIIMNLIIKWNTVQPQELFVYNT